MKLFAIRDSEIDKQKDLAYLIYYEKAKSFYIEVPESISQWEAPMLLASFVKKGCYSINSYWSKQWVRQRIVPTDRQNLGVVLKDNQLTEYDEYRLLLLGKGRCAQDNCYLVPIKGDALPKLLQQRYATKVEDVIPIAHHQLLVFFRNGKVKKVIVEKLVGEDKAYLPVLRSVAIFEQVRLLPGGYGVTWGQELQIPDIQLYAEGTTIPLELEDFLAFARQRVVSASEACKLLGCSRQNLNKLVKSKQIHPFKQEEKLTLFLKKEIEERKR